MGEMSTEKIYTPAKLEMYMLADRKLFQIGLWEGEIIQKYGIIPQLFYVSVRRPL